MNRCCWPALAAFLALVVLALPARADKSMVAVAEEVNEKVVKLYGSGGFQGLAAYGSGIIVSEDGFILTMATLMLDTRDLRVHLSDGRRFNQVQVVAVEPVLDVALVKIANVRNLPYFDVLEAARKPLAEPGTGILAFSNQFQIATRSEPVSVQRGVISAYSKLLGHRGVYEAPFSGDVYFSDAIMCNPGAAGGALTNRKGELLGIVGREVRNQLTATWVNYAIPIQASGKGIRQKQEVTVSIPEMIDKVVVKKEPWNPTDPKVKNEGPIAYHGIVLVPDILERTPPYVEELERGSPASRSGLKPDDLIVYVDGIQVASIKAFKELVNNVGPDTEITLEVQRGNKLESIKLKLEKKPTPKKP